MMRNSIKKAGNKRLRDITTSDLNSTISGKVKYEDYNSVGNGECEFIIGNTSYIYDISTCTFVYQFIYKELITNKDAYTYIPEGKTEEWYIRKYFFKI